MRFTNLLVLAACAASMSQTELAATVLPPTAKWHVDFSETQCLASRSYGTATDDTFLAIKQPPLGDSVQLAVLKPHRSSSTGSEETDGRIRFDNGPAIPVSFLFFNSPKTGRRVITVNIPRTVMERNIDAKAMTVEASDLLRETFALSDMRPMFHALGRCATDLRQYWNVPNDEETTAEASGAAAPGNPHRAIGKLTDYLRSEDYPDDAIRHFEQGKVKFALLVDQQGKIADCTVIATSGVALLDAQSCIVLRDRAVFKPATDKDGNAVRDGMISSIRWVIPQ